MSDPLVSVIIPIYNAQKYLRECLDSVLGSTYRNLEVILVNDGSEDHSFTICREYALQDSRIVMLSQKNRGLCAARNLGLSNAGGKYIAFVDADDTVSPFFYELCVRTMEETAVDFIGCEYTNNQNDLVLTEEQSAFNMRILDNLDDILSVLTQGPATRKYTWTCCMVWNKFYKREKILELFDLGCITAEDLIFNWNYAVNCRKMAIIPLSLYYWRENEQSLTRTASRERVSERACRNLISDAKASMSIAKSQLPLSQELRCYLEMRAAHKAHQTIWRIFVGGHEEQYAEFIADARKTISQYWLRLVSSSDCDIKVRVMCICCRFAFSLWKIAVRVLGKKLS